MASIVDTPGAFDPVTRIETSDLALGGNEINSPNKQLKELARRDVWLLNKLQTYIGVGDTVAQNSFEAFKQAGIVGLSQGRLTLTTGNPTGNATASTSLFYTPYNGDLVSLYNVGASRWEAFAFTERTLPLAGLAANTNYDIFLWNNAGTLTLEAVAWTNSTTRAQPIAMLNGAWVKAADSRRYLGTIRTIGTIGQCTDDASRRLVFNSANRIPRPLLASFSGSWTYGTNTFRPSNNNTTIGQGRFDLVTGLPQEVITITAITTVTGGSPTISAGLNSTTLNNLPQSAGNTIGGGANAGAGAISIGTLILPVGSNFVQILELATGGVSTNFTQADIRGLINA